jgi:hypothetical protein
MPLMAAYEQNDARDSARLLAERTIEGLESEQHSASTGNSINNMYRLLQSYRLHGFYGYFEHTRPDDDGSITSLLVSSDKNVGDLGQALDSTFQTVFIGQDPGQAIDGMKGVLRMVAFPEAGERPDPTDVARTKRFFETLLDHLKA